MENSFSHERRESLKRVTLTEKIGEGEEFFVYKIAETPFLVAKKPKSQETWGDANLSIPQYHLKIYQALQNIPSASEFLPQIFYVAQDSRNEEVIIVNNFNPTEKGIVLAMADLNDETMVGKLKTSGITLKHTTEFLQKTRKVLGDDLLDNAAAKNMIIPADAFHVVISPEGYMSLMLDDFGSVVDISGKKLTKDQIKQFLETTFLNVLLDIGRLKNITEGS